MGRCAEVEAKGQPTKEEDRSYVSRDELSHHVMMKGGELRDGGYVLS